MKKNQIINEFYKKIMKKKERKGELREKLTKTKTRHKMRKAIKIKKEKFINNDSNSIKKYNTIKK